MTDQPRLLHPRFEATFNLGQVAQIVSVLATVIGAYFAMSADIRRLDDRAALKFESIDRRLGTLETVIVRLGEAATNDARQDERISQTRAELDRLRNTVEQNLRPTQVK